MVISDRDVQRLNVSMPVANDIKLGSIIKALQEGGGGGGGITQDASAYSAVIRQLANQAQGEVIGLDGKAAFSITFDDSPNFIKTNMLAEMKSRQFPFALGLIADPTNGNNSMITPTEVVQWCHRYGCQIWSHSMTHTTPNTVDDLKREIVDSKALIEQTYPGIKVAGFIQPGVNPTGLYNNLDKNDNPGNLNSEAGTLLYRTYAHYSGYIGSSMRQLPTGPYFGASRLTVSPVPPGKTSAQHRATVIDQINTAVKYKWGIALLVHPQWVDYENKNFSNYINLSDLLAIFDAIKAARDAGTAEVLSYTGLWYADPTATKRLDLAKLYAMGFEGVSQQNPGFWSATTVWSDKTFTANGYWGGPSFIQDNSQSNSGTNSLIGQASYLFNYPGELFEIRGKVRSTGSSAQKIKIQLSSQSGTFLDIQSGAQWGEIIAQPGDGTDIRIPFAIPTDTTWLRIALGRGNGAAGSGNGLEWSDLKIVKI